MRALSALLFIALLGCTDPYAAAQEADTIEAYEKYLSENPTGTYTLQAKTRLEELMIQKAEEDQTIESYDAYLARFPDGQLKEKAMESREAVLFEWADQTNTAEAFQKFLDEYPRGEKKRKQEARRRLNMANNRAAVEIGAVSMTAVNMANDPEQPPNGWGFTVDVTNKGDKPITLLMLQIDYLDGDGNTLGKANYPSVGSRYPGRSWVEDAYKEPLAPGQTRAWEYKSADMPEGWSQKVTVKPVNISFEPQK
ncbi:MAG: hypothetical protein AAFV53_43500 [Myxococcota bacterium]